MRFQDLIDNEVLQIGDGYRAKHSELGMGGPIFLRAAHLQESGFDFSGAEYFDRRLKERVAPKLAVAGDVVITTKGNSTGRTGFVNGKMPPFVYSPHLSFWRSRDREALDPAYLRYWALGPEFKVQLESLKHQTDMAPYLSLRDQRNLRISLQPIEEQRSVARTLGALDDKIELNRKMSRTLEATAQAIFKSWFVDFDPVVAKTDGRKPFGMSDELASLFPGRFVDSKLGPIPEGWQWRLIPDAFEINPKRKLEWKKLAPYLSMQNAQTNSALPSVWGQREYGSGVTFQNGDTLIAKITPCLENGKTAFVAFLEDDEIGWGSTEFIVLRSRPPIPSEASYFLARLSDFRNHLIANMTGSSGRQRVPVGCLQHYSLAVAPESILRCFGFLACAMFKKLIANAEESQCLAELRDLLLPKLLSGEIRVREAEKAVEAAGV